MQKNIRAALFGVMALTAISANASVILSIGAGTAVGTVARQATFTGIESTATLLNYTEDNLIVSLPNYHCCFPGVHYGNAGGADYVTITTPDSLNFSGLELDLGTGFSDGLHDVVWETLRDGFTTGSGVIAGTIRRCTLADRGRLAAPAGCARAGVSGNVHPRGGCTMRDRCLFPSALILSRSY